MSKSTSVDGLDPSSGSGQESGNGACVFDRTIFVVHLGIFRQRGQPLRIVPPPRRNVAHRRHGGGGSEKHDGHARRSDRL